MTRILSELPPALRTVARELRRAIGAAAPELRETVKWGSPVWVGRSPVACLMLYRDHVNLGFFRGAAIRSRFPELEGTGKGLRHLKAYSLADARRPVVARLVRAAARRDRSRP